MSALKSLNRMRDERLPIFILLCLTLFSSIPSALYLWGLTWFMEYHLEHKILYDSLFPLEIVFVKVLAVIKFICFPLALFLYARRFVKGEKYEEDV